MNMNGGSVPNNEADLQLAGLKLESLLSKVHQEDGKLIGARVLQGTATTTINEWKPREIRLQVTSETGVLLNIFRFYFPNRTAQLNNGTLLAVQPSMPDGLLEVAVSPGDHQLILYLEYGREEYTGWIISLASSAVILILLGILIMRRKKFGVTT